MARWDPGTEQRLRKAALELFGEHGYDDVTVTQIAERAGITRRTFFRYFPDKREVLFAGSERLPAALADAVLAADATEPLPAVLDALRAVGAQVVELADQVAHRRAVIAASAELQERERSKHAAATAAIEGALRQRGVAPATARLAAQLGAVAFQNAVDRWVDAGGGDDFATCLDEVATAMKDVVR